jgi:rhodanese-related sulfurtransferase
LPVPEISAATLAQKLEGPEEDRPLLVDVRSADEHQYVCLPGSILLPLPEIDQRDEEIAAFTGKRVVVYCHLGVRSLHGAAYLRSRGIDACSLAGGIEAWAVNVDPQMRRY